VHNLSAAPQQAGLTGAPGRYQDVLSGQTVSIGADGRLDLAGLQYLWLVRAG
jgi:hypothetical protein